MSVALSVLEEGGASLPQLIDKAAAALVNARSAAEVLDARDMASLAYDVAKKAGRMAQAKGAHDTLIAAAHRAQADALLIESQAKRRLADEYDAAQERGEVQSQSGNIHARTSGGQFMPDLPNEKTAPNAADLGLSHKAVFEARQLRDAEERDPGIVARTIEAALQRGDEPTRADVSRATMREKIIYRAAQDEKQGRAERDLKQFRKFWKSCGPLGRDLIRKFIEAQS